MIQTPDGPRWLTVERRELGERYHYVLRAWESTQGDHWTTYYLDGHHIGAVGARVIPREQREAEERTALLLIQERLGDAYLDWHSWGMIDYIITRGTLELFSDFPIDLPYEFATI